ASLTPSSKRRLQLLHMDLCDPMRVANINGKIYVLVIVDDYSRYTWTHFLRSKDDTPEVLIDFLRLVQRGLQAQVGVVRTDKGMEFLNQTLHAYFAVEGIKHQTPVAQTPEKNGVVERRNRTLVEAARTMLSDAKVPLFFWAEAIATACFTQNHSLVIPRHEKTPYHIINDRKLLVKFFHIFGSVCYIVRDGENLDKMKEKGDECIFVGYSTQSKAYRVFKKRTRVIMESIRVNFDELPQMASDQNSSDPAPKYRTITTSNELDLLFSPMFDELLNGSSKVVSKSSVVSAVDAPNQRQQLITPLTNHTTLAPTCQILTLAPSVILSENINQAETYAKNDQFADDEFINIFSNPIQDQRETSSRHSKSLEILHNLLELDDNLNWMLRCEELHQFDRLDVWELVDRPLCINVINLKWLWKNKRDEENTVIRNKSHLVAKGYAQKEGVDFEESFAPVARDDDKLYKFKEGDFKRLYIQDIEDILLLLKHCHPMACGRSSIRCRKLPNKLNLTKPDTYRSDLKRKEAYTAYSNPRGFIYQNKDKQNILRRIDELHKFNDGTLSDVRTALDDRLKGIRMQYLPQTIWRRSDKDRATAMIQAIDKQLKTRRIKRIWRSLLVGD
nr:Gag-Pol polyprotein [Tanacetum cinerariifolium]